MKTMEPKRLNITQEMIQISVPGCPYNNPVAIALKEQMFPEASEILVTGEDIFVDGVMVNPTVPMIRFILDFDRGKTVKPSILGFYL